MFFHSTLLAGVVLASSVSAQPSPSAYVEPTVPTGKPIAGDYRGALRPQIHFSPPKDFMVSCASALRPVESAVQTSLWSGQSLLIFWLLRTIRMACSWMPMESTISTTNVLYPFNLL